MVYELKPEHVKDYAEMHKTAHQTVWKAELDALKKAGARNCITYIYKNYSILLIECEEIDDFFTKLGKSEDNRKWQATTAPWFAVTAKFDGSAKAEPIEKIFDLREQLKGRLTKY
jgi:L-rhamnose mutarotase